MKRSIVFTVIALCTMTTGVLAQGGFGLSIKPGMVVNAAHFGMKSDAFFAGVGLEFASVGFSNKYTYEEGSSSQKADVSVFLPQLAGKFYLGSSGEGEGGVVRPFIWTSLFYSIATAKVSSTNGTTTTRDTTTERMISDVLGGNLGGSVAFGGEYFFAPRFGLSGEFGARLLFGGQKSSYEYGEYSETMTTSLGLGVTYTTLGLNFYF
jgi:hypothetical protein